jgi:hypothetical protein
MARWNTEAKRPAVPIGHCLLRRVQDDVPA